MQISTSPPSSTEPLLKEQPFDCSHYAQGGGQTFVGGRIVFTSGNRGRLPLHRRCKNLLSFRRGRCPHRPVLYHKKSLFFRADVGISPYNVAVEIYWCFVGDGGCRHPALLSLQQNIVLYIYF